MKYREDSPPIGGAYNTSVTAHYQCLNTLICIVYETGITAIWTLTRETEFNAIKSAAPSAQKKTHIVGLVLAAREPGTGASLA